MITQEEIDKERKFFGIKYNETSGANWVKSKLELWDKVQQTHDYINELKFEIHLRDEQLRKQHETLSYIEKVFESLGFLGEHSFLFSRNPKPIDGFYTLALLQLMPNEEPFKKTLLSYFHGISNERIQRASENYLERESQKLNTAQK